MNKQQKALIEKCIRVNMWDEVPLLDEICILPTNDVHDSGYKIMYVIGSTYEDLKSTTTLSNSVGYYGLYKLSIKDDELKIETILSYNQL